MIKSFTLPFLIGHRGIAHYGPENTLAGITAAHKLGFKWVEFDVMLTKCGEVIVHHDLSVDRTTNGSGYIYDLTYEEIKKLDAGSKFSLTFSDEIIPTLADVIQHLKKYNLGANIEIKSAPHHIIETTRRVMDIIHQYWPSTLPPPLISSFSWAALKHVRELDNDIAIGLLLEHWDPWWEKKANELRCITVNMAFRSVSFKRVKQIKETNRFVLIYTVNSQKQAEHLLRMGVDAIFTDNLLPNKLALFP